MQNIQQHSIEKQEKIRISGRATKWSHITTQTDLLTSFKLYFLNNKLLRTIHLELYKQTYLQIWQRFKYHTFLLSDL